MITADVLQRATLCNSERAATWAPVLSEAMGIFAIDSPARQAAFLAQIAHESGRLIYVRELWGPLPQQLRYEGRADLGNTQKGDGFKYRGRGLIQTTGRANYRSTAIGLRQYAPNVPDFEAQPEALELPKWAALSAGWYWANRGLNALADAGDFDRITRRINGGINGLPERLMLWSSAKTALNAL